MASAITAAPAHLNATGCEIRYTAGKGRGVFAARAIPAHTLVEVSPVLLFGADEYALHGRHTALDHYTFTWRDGRMALALGLGSLFNHAHAPNVSFSLDRRTESIRYTTTRDVREGEELCIFYGHKLWFEDVDAPAASASTSEDGDAWGGLGAIAEGEREGLSAIVAEEDLPFERIRITPDEDEEEDMAAIRTVDAWAVDIADPKHTTAMLKWLKASGHDTPALAHLKRIRKTGALSTLLLSSSPAAPSLPADLALSPPYALPVPRTAALTPTSLALKNSLWPTVFAPRRKDAPAPWSRAKVRWAHAAMRAAVRAAREAAARGELPVAAHIPPPFAGDGEEEEDEDGGMPAFTAADSRASAQHPLRHAAMAAVRLVGDYRARPSASAPDPGGAEKNGQRYLLTSLSLFSTHEPCVMCSMALLHSRVKEVFYLFPMAQTGGCGGAACLPRLEGVNHRFGIGRWREVRVGMGLEVDEGCDA